MRPAIERTLAFPALNRIYAEIVERDSDTHFCERALEVLGITVGVPQDQLDRVPASGPVVVVANHPFGGIEGLIMAALLRRIRPDVKLVANYLLHLIPDLRDSFFFVDPFGGADSVARNSPAIRSAIQWVRDGHLLGVFPAGEVSHLELRRGSVTDPKWLDTAGRIVQRAGASVVPMYFEGQNSRLFQLLGLLHSSLRTMMLPRELFKKQQTTISVRIGKPIAPAKLQRFSGSQELTAYLRVQTYILGGVEADKAAAPQAPPELAVAPPGAAEALAAGIAALPDECALLTNAEFGVYCARAEQLPQILPEIGRLRELSFRQAGEGTGKPRDIDEFDEHYYHLFVWNHEANELVGAYRMAAVDEIVPALGISGLYTSTLFQYKRRLLDQLNPALELGRSFVRPKYQKHHAPLSLLWRGIGRFVCDRPKYRRLFGPVSISNEYQSLSKQLLISFLEQNHSEGDLGRFVRPKSPPRLGPIRAWDPETTSIVARDAKEVGELISRIETDMKSVPVLLRQYLKLNASLLAFNVDADFGDVLDALMLVDMTAVSPAILVRYMGKDPARAFLAHHGIQL